jgi:hypothetical protein
MMNRRVWTTVLVLAWAALTAADQSANDKATRRRLRGLAHHGNQVAYNKTSKEAKLSKKHKARPSDDDCLHEQVAYKFYKSHKSTSRRSMSKAKGVSIYSRHSGDISQYLDIDPVSTRERERWNGIA